MNRCNKCVLPDSLAGLTFDENGVCSKCKTVSPSPSAFGEYSFIDLISKRSSARNQYDCIVPISGGRDSAFVLYCAKKKYDLRVLAVNFDNEFRTDQATQNIRNAVEALGVDFISVRSRGDLVHKIVKSSVLLSCPLGPGAVAGSLCAPCGYGYRSAIYQVAQQNNVPLILWGDSALEKAEGELGKFAKPRKTSFLSKLFSRDIFMRASLHYHDYKFKKEFHSSKPVFCEEIHYFDYVEWDQGEIRMTIQGQLGWRKPKDGHSDWRIDCVLHPLLDYLCHKQYGVTKTEVGFSNMIRAGKMERSEALDILSHEDINERRLLYTQILKNIGLTDEQCRMVFSFS